MGLLHLSLDFVQHLLHPSQLEQAHESKLGLSESPIDLEKCPQPLIPSARALVALRCDGVSG